MELKLKNKAAFGLGAFGKDIVYMLVNSYLLYYYNVVLGMSSAFIGTLLMAARIFDAINDPFMGIVVAKTKTRWGRFRPWIFSGTVLNAVAIYALFAVPDSMGHQGMKLWLAIIYIAWGISYTLMDIPFWSMIPAITSPGKDREQLSSLARSCAGIGAALPTVLTMVVVPVLSGSSVVADYRIGFKWWALIVAVVFIISEVVFCLFVPEKNVVEMETPGIGQMFRSLFHNDQALTVVGAVILVYTALNLVGNLILYFFQFDIGNEKVYSIFVGACFATQVITMMLVPAMRNKIKKIKLFRIGILVQVVGFAILLVFALTEIYNRFSWWLICIPGMIVYAGYGILNVMLTIFLSDSVDYGEVKNKSREESVIFSMQTFTVKLASGIAVFVAGLGLDLINLDTEAEKQTLSALKGLRFLISVPSVLCLAAALILFTKCYRLSDEKMNEIAKQLEAGKNTESEEL